MKYIKTYETIIEPEFGDEPEVGDYVICEEVLGNNFSDLMNYLSTHIGKFIRYAEANDLTDRYEYPYLIEYKNVYKKIAENFRNGGRKGETCRAMNLSEIKHWSKNKEELESILVAKKYNL